MESLKHEQCLTACLRLMGRKLLVSLAMEASSASKGCNHSMKMTIC